MTRKQINEIKLEQIYTLLKRTIKDYKRTRNNYKNKEDSQSWFGYSFAKKNFVEMLISEARFLKREIALTELKND